MMSTLGAGACLIESKFSFESSLMVDPVRRKPAASSPRSSDALGGGRHRQRRAEPHTEEAHVVHSAAELHFVDRALDAVEPSAHAIRIIVAPRRVARAVVVEAEHWKSRSGEALGEMAVRAVRAHRLVAHRAAPGDAARARAPRRRRRGPTK